MIKMTIAVLLSSVFAFSALADKYKVTCATSIPGELKDDAEVKEFQRLLENAGVDVSSVFTNFKSENQTVTLTWSFVTENQIFSGPNITIVKEMVAPQVSQLAQILETDEQDLGFKGCSSRVIEKSPVVGKFERRSIEKFGEFKKKN